MNEPLKGVQFELAIIANQIQSFQDCQLLLYFTPNFIRGYSNSTLSGSFCKQFLYFNP
jgi:hypothetical protein